MVRMVSLSFRQGCPIFKNKGNTRERYKKVRKPRKGGRVAVERQNK